MEKQYIYKNTGFPVPAQKAGEELERIEQKFNRLITKEIVDESRPEEAVLHPVFEWEDPIAAEKYRQHQARFLIRHITYVVSDDKKGEKREVRAFHSVPNKVDIKDENGESIKKPYVYMNTEKAMGDPENRLFLLQSFFRRIEELQVSFRDLVELREIFSFLEDKKQEILKEAIEMELDFWGK